MVKDIATLELRAAISQETIYHSHTLKHFESTTAFEPQAQCSRHSALMCRLCVVEKSNWEQKSDGIKLPYI